MEFEYRYEYVNAREEMVYVVELTKFYGNMKGKTDGFLFEALLEIIDCINEVSLITIECMFNLLNISRF